MTRKRVILIGFLSLLLGVGALVGWGQYRRRGAELYYSGTIEAIQSNLAFQVSGRVQVLTDEAVRWKRRRFWRSWIGGSL